ncbi:ADP-ribosylglycohydrolase family protein [Pseudolysinimonas kribbensis]|uniref:ADP-ribosylglycohydrolase n=1 Tax=Pseudolysinimonas kribbensis TaxID=433641 RepID=A0ABQ6K599_9MICO|nr:ADP-ribosylglycohydrolase family protein [Pseudolysinimonas kribbensis]GMA95801.1 ADP-ribosylglycohydrolase [Pseudolysinimonas kribbensis]
MTGSARALAALQGLAIGDALGMPTQLLSPDAIVERYGAIEGFRAAVHDHPIAAGLPAGSVTDDTEQALLLGRLLLETGGRVPAREWADRLAAWEDRMRARGSLDLLGPSTRAAIAAIRAGADPADAGRTGTTNGAAMRIAPVGIATGSRDLAALVDLVAEACRPTHDTGIAIAGAAAVAAAVSAGIDGADRAAATEVAIAAAELGERRGHWIAGASVAARIGWAVALTAHPDGAERLIALVGTSLATQESVPAAFGILALAGGDGWTACLAAANHGGDTDTIGAMAGAIAGATGSAWPAGAVQTVTTVNELDLEPLVGGLLALRAAA